MGVRLPAEYQEVEYLESDKNSYIDTGVIFSEANYTVLTDIMLLASQDTNLFGMRGYSSGNHSAFVVGAKNAGIESGTNWQILNNASSWHYSTNKDVFRNQKYSIKYQYNNTGVLLNVDDIDQIVLSFTPRWNDFVDLPMYLFVQNSGYREVRADECYKMRCYSFIVNRNNVTVLNLIPCYRRADNVPGMYDLISSTFLTNLGTGEFTVGPDVIDSISPLMVAWRRGLIASSGNVRPIRLEHGGLNGGLPSNGAVDLAYRARSNRCAAVMRGKTYTFNVQQTAGISVYFSTWTYDDADGLSPVTNKPWLAVGEPFTPDRDFVKILISINGPGATNKRINLDELVAPEIRRVFD